MALGAGEDADVAHLDHGGHELGREDRWGGALRHQGLRLGVILQGLVRLQQALSGLQVAVEHVVQAGGRGDVQVHLVGATAGALRSQRRCEVGVEGGCQGGVRQSALDRPTGRHAHAVRSR